MSMKLKQMYKGLKRQVMTIHVKINNYDTRYKNENKYLTSKIYMI